MARATAPGRRWPTGSAARYSTRYRSSGKPMMSKPHVRPRSCSIFCSASTATNVPVRADVFSAIEIANICPRTATAPASSPAATIVSTSEKPDSDSAGCEFCQAVHIRCVLLVAISLAASNSSFMLRAARPRRGFSKEFVRSGTAIAATWQQLPRDQCSMSEKPLHASRLGADHPRSRERRRPLYAVTSGQNQRPNIRVSRAAVGRESRF